MNRRPASRISASHVFLATVATVILLLPAVGSCRSLSQILTATVTIDNLALASIHVVNVARTGVPTLANGVIISPSSSTPYILFVDSGLNATGTQRNLRGYAGIAAYDLCQDPACATVWAPNGDPSTGLLVTPGSVRETLPLTVVRSAHQPNDDTLTDVVTLTMYF